jgi:hypothetical protein
MIERIALKIAAADATTPSGDTGRGVMGELLQLRWVPTVVETGASLSLVQVNRNSGDTAGSSPILTIEDLGSSNRQWCPRQPQHGVDGNPDPSDTGAAFGVPWVFGGDRLRVKVVPAGVGVIAGTLYAWIKK